MKGGTPCGDTTPSFRDDFVFPTDQKWTEIAKQIGNAVPPLLAESIADAVATGLDAVSAGTASVDVAA